MPRPSGKEISKPLYDDVEKVALVPDCKRVDASKTKWLS